MDYYGRMAFKHRFLLSVLVASVSFAQAQPTVEPAAGALNSELTSGLFYQLLLGEMNAHADEPGAAFSLILDAARKTNDPVLYKRAVHIALDARAGDSALLAAHAWSQAQPESREANRYVLRVLLGLNRVAETLEPLKRDITLSPSKDQRELIWAIPANFENVSDHLLVANTVQKALTGWLADAALGPTAWAVIGRLRLSASDQVAALTGARAGLALDAKDEHPALLALSMMQPNLPEAEALVRKHLPSARPEFQMAYVKALLGTKRDADAMAQLNAMTVKYPDYLDTWLLIGALALQGGDLDQSERELKQYLAKVDKTPPAQMTADMRRGRTQAFHSLAQVAQQRKDFAGADAWLQRIDNPDDVLRAQIRRAALLAQQGKLDEGIAMIRSLPERADDDSQTKLSAEVQLLREHKQYARARAVLQSKLALNPNDLDDLYELAMLHEKLGELDDMERLLRQLMQAKPDDPQAFNALGYSLADRGLRLPEAKALIQKALQISPHDPFITDSLAWVEFRSGNLSEALALLQGAFKDRPDAEIAGHLGEVLWVLKRPAEAQEIWREGLKLSPGNESVMDTLKRLQVSP
jgi:tetratricopeptide (TPR) repeat protein